MIHNIRNTRDGDEIVTPALDPPLDCSRVEWDAVEARKSTDDDISLNCLRVLHRRSEVD